MRNPDIFISLLCSALVLTLGVAVIGFSGDQTTANSSVAESPAAAAQGGEWAYPIAPGVWYPGQPLPEKPMRYYRVRCWPGCHSGSDFGKYPQKSLNMKPLHPTSALRSH